MKPLLLLIAMMIFYASCAYAGNAVDPGALIPAAPVKITTYKTTGNGVSFQVYTGVKRGLAPTIMGATGKYAINPRQLTPRSIKAIESTPNPSQFVIYWQ